VNRQDPNLVRVEAVAGALGELCDELVFVGGCAASLLVDSPSAPPVRVTLDVDLVAEVASRTDYYVLERRFGDLGLVRDSSEGAPLCRWRLGEIAVDLMPTVEKVLGFTNRWYSLAVTTASTAALPSGQVIRLITAPAFLATKFEAFCTRGRGDILASHDLEDILNVVEGRRDVVHEVSRAESSLRSYLAHRFQTLIDHPDFLNALPGLVVYDDLHQDRVEAVRRRIRALAE